MDINHRKLVADPGLCPSFCAKVGPTYCPKSCSDHCPNISCVYFYDPNTIPSPSYPISSAHHSHKALKFVTVTTVLLAASFLLTCGYAFYTKYYNNSRRGNSSHSDHQPRDDLEFLDEEHGPIVDHPIWYIRTTGLQPSIINSITALKYKRGEGIVEGTECSVCLSEFQEDESLRLLPKCSHAFHIPCIDTWLRSHTNCPMCRAPIVINSVIMTSLPQPSGVNSSSEEETQTRVSENDGEDDLEMGRVEEAKRGESPSDDDMVESSRRSFLLDSSSGSKICVAVSKECNESTMDKRLEIDYNLRSASGGKEGSGKGKLERMRSGSSNERSVQSGTVSMKRSVSCSGKFVLCR